MSMSSRTHPSVIQGGMGIGVSGWLLARKVSEAGHLGVVSGTGIWIVVARTLQNGDPGGHYRRALDAFPNQEIAGRVLKRYFLPHGRGGRPYRSIPMLSLRYGSSKQQGTLDPDLEGLIVVSSFAEVWLAKEGHLGVVGVNLLEKIQLMLLPVLYGAMLAGVDYVLIGAGIPNQVPEVLDLLANNKPATYRLHVEDASSEDDFQVIFAPDRIQRTVEFGLKRPNFLAIISTDVLATILVNRSGGEIQGFVVEGPTAGGHNAPPRGKQISPDGEPVYGPKDQPNLAKLKGLGLPFWLAGSYARPDGLLRARELGAEGIQVGTIFALSKGSGFRDDLRSRVLAKVREGTLKVRTDARISPSGYPFKVASIEGTIADQSVVRRQQVCDLGALRTLYKQANGKIGYRCPSEPEDHFLKKGGHKEDIEGRGCVCNALCSTIGLGQLRPTTDTEEPPLVTLGDDVEFVMDLPDGYDAKDALSYLLST